MHSTDTSAAPLRPTGPTRRSVIGVVVIGAGIVLSGLAIGSRVVVRGRRSLPVGLGYLEPTLLTTPD